MRRLTSEEVRAIPFPPCGENCTMLSPSSFFLANPLRWALLGGRGCKEARAIPFPPCGENSIMLSPSSFFLANPLRWALLGVREVGRAFRLDGLRHICVSKVKNHTKIHRCQVQAVLTRQKGGQTTKRPQGILCVLARPLRMYGRSFCPSKPCVSLSTEGKILTGKQNISRLGEGQ